MGHPCMILSDIGAEGMTGRGTWVFRGYLKSDPDRTQVVIKDTWIATGKIQFSDISSQTW